MDIFDQQAVESQSRTAPLADRMRPQRLDEFIGQEHILGTGKILREMIERDNLSSLIFWGPPGTGKTTLAQIMANKTGSVFVWFSAVTSGIKEVREIVQRAKDNLGLHSKRTILFCDEIHRFNKAQQDAFLPHVERGTIVLVGATTENPSFEVISALLSRSKVFVLKPLMPAEIVVILRRAIKDEDKGLGNLTIEIDEDVLKIISEQSEGDARRALNTLETAVAISKRGKDGRVIIAKNIAEEAMQKKTPLYDKSGEEHYNVVSAFIKSLRGSDPDAAIYWMTRMLEAGEDPLFIVRRMVVFASEDIGNADPRALSVAVAAKDAVHFVGMPEAGINLAQAVTYLATAPKSNASYAAYKEAMSDVQTTSAEPVPFHIRNAPTNLMKDLGYGKDYKYAHDYETGFVPQEYLPDKLKGKTYYQPSDRGYEKHISGWLENWRKLKQQEDRNIRKTKDK